MTVCPFALWRPVQNHSGAMSAHLGLILHVQQGNGGLSGYFNDPANQASSTWWVAKTGTLEQYVDADVRAWAQSAGNATYNSVETEGFVAEPLTPPQEATLARLYNWSTSVYGWPNALSEAPGQPGFGWHGEGGSAWGGHVGCPGDVRKPRRQPILDAAFGAPQPTPLPPPAPTPAPAPVGHVVMPLTQQGATGRPVRIVQAIVGSPVDGQFGPNTRVAVTSMQRILGASPDGAVGDDTWTRFLQYRLTLIYGGGRPAIDGDYGQQTTAFVTWFQATHHLPVDGIAGPNTFGALTGQ